MDSPFILGIESSCDETSAAVVRAGEELISNVVYSQIPTHQPYGGVVPEIASREHLRAIVPVVRRALEQAGHSYESIDALAVTNGPGLAGALLVGVTYAKTLAYALNKPLIAVNHLEGHIHAVLLEQRQRGNAQLDFPVLALVVSGGHTHLYLVEQRGNSWSYHNVGHTRDDAAGEAFDKVAKLLALGYPGGPVIDRLAQLGDSQGVNFPTTQIKHRDRNDHGPVALRPEFDFSFSGIKTAVLRYVETHDEVSRLIEPRRHYMAATPKAKPEELANLCGRQTLDLIASFQRAVVDDLVIKTLAAAAEYDVRTILVTGGVAANSQLRATFERRALQSGLPVYFPSRPMSTDNAAMIAAAAYPKWLERNFASHDLSIDPTLQLK